MSCSVPHGVDEEKLSVWLENGVEEEDAGESCCFIAGKRTKELSCKRHGGLLPPLRRSAGGACPVRVEVHTPEPLPATGLVRVIVVLRGVHSHVLPVCKPSSRTAQKIVDDNPTLSIRALQVCHLFPSSQIMFLSLTYWSWDRVFVVHRSDGHLLLLVFFAFFFF